MKGSANASQSLTPMAPLARVRREHASEYLYQLDVFESMAPNEIILIVLNNCKLLVDTHIFCIC